MDLVLVFIDFNYVKYIMDFHLSFISYDINMIAIILIIDCIVSNRHIIG